MAAIEIGILGGSGLYELELEEASWVDVETPFGAPSDSLRVGTLEGRRVGFLARHGRGHRLLPTEVPSRANLYALKSLGATRVLSAVQFAWSALGAREQRTHEALFGKGYGLSRGHLEYTTNGTRGQYHNP